MAATQTGFDFEAMTRLAQEDPAAFAGAREALLRRLIGASAQARQLASLQLDIDAARHGAQPGVRRGERMQALMLERIACMTAHLARLNDLLEAAAAPADSLRRSRPDSASAAARVTSGSRR